MNGWYVAVNFGDRIEEYRIDSGGHTITYSVFGEILTDVAYSKSASSSYIYATGGIRRYRWTQGYNSSFDSISLNTNLEFIDVNPNSEDSILVSR